MAGKTILMAESALLPTQLAMKRPSTTLYIEVKIIMITEGKVKRRSLAVVK